MSLIFGALTTEVMFSVRKEDTGSASAVVGSLQYTTAAAAGAAVNLLPENSALPIFALFAAFSLAALVCWTAGRTCVNRRTGGAPVL